MYAAHPLAPDRPADVRRTTAATAAASIAAPLRAGSLALRAAAAAAIASWRHRRRVAAGRRELHGLDARLLADIGLDRGGIEGAVRHGRGR